MDLTESAAWRRLSAQAEIHFQSELFYVERLEQLLLIVGNRRLSREKRLDARQKVNDLHSAHYSARFDWNENSNYDISSSDTDSDDKLPESDVSDVELTRSERDWLWEYHMMDSVPNAKIKFERILEESLQRKKQQKRALRAEAIAEEAARAARAAQIEREKREIEREKRLEKELLDAEESSSAFLQGIFDLDADADADDES
jgi:hypothetical protein